MSDDREIRAVHAASLQRILDAGCDVFLRTAEDKQTAALSASMLLLEKAFAILDMHFCDKSDDKLLALLAPVLERRASV